MTPYLPQSCGTWLWKAVSSLSQSLNSQVGSSLNPNTSEILTTIHTIQQSELSCKSLMEQFLFSYLSFSEFLWHLHLTGLNLIPGGCSSLLPLQNCSSSYLLLGTSQPLDLNLLCSFHLGWIPSQVGLACHAASFKTKL